jgi:hypothetical protein
MTVTMWIVSSSLDRLDDPAPVEAHLLVCEERRARLTGRDEYVGVISAALQRFTGTPPSVGA